MSGGSFDYLYSLCDDISYLADRKVYIEEMVIALKELGAEDVAQDTQKVVDLMNQAAEQAVKLQRVWHDIEWWKSCDYSKDQALEGIEEYRQGQHYV